MPETYSCGDVILFPQGSLFDQQPQVLCRLRLSILHSQISGRVPFDVNQRVIHPVLKEQFQNSGENDQTLVAFYSRTNFAIVMPH